MEQQRIKNLIDAQFQQVVAWRRHLHQHPELSFMEFETSNYIANVLKNFEGIEISRPTKTSVVGRLKGLKGEGKTIAMRADIDALPINEEVDEPFRSQNEGVMHACGHDGHTSILLGVASILHQIREELSGEYVFIFQHAEEVPPGGAREMVEAGVLNGVDFVLGMHLWSTTPVGKATLSYGAISSSSDIFDVVVKGQSGHGSMPDQAIDALAIAAQIVTNLQMIVSRQISPLDSGVVSITRFHSGEAYNVIPQEAKIGGTIRTLSNSVREQIKQSIEQISSSVAAAHGATIEMQYQYGYDPVVNNDALTEIVEQQLRQIEELEVEIVPPMMGGEDFSAFSNVVPGCYIGIGAMKEREGKHYPHHHPQFEIHEDAFKLAMHYFISSATTIVTQ